MLQDSSIVPIHPPSERFSLVPPERLCHWVMFCVTRDFGLDVGTLIAPTRGAPQIAFARQAAMYLAHVVFALSFEIIGRAFGRDRTTVAHACRVIEDSRDDIWINVRIEALEMFCRAAPDLSDNAIFPSRGDVG